MARARAVRSAFGRVGIDDERLLEDRADLLARVERAVGILEHELHGAPQALQLAGGGLTASRPSMVSAPEVGGSIRVTMRASVDLPQPDSPTTASVRPGSTAKDTPLTA